MITKYRHLILWSIIALFTLTTGCAVSSDQLLLKAVYDNKVEAVNRYIKEGEDINQSDGRGYTALMIATYYNFYSVADSLLKGGADINAQSNDGWTALMLATCNKNIRMVKLLLQYNPDVSIADNDGQTALSHAAILKLKVISDLIEKHKS